MTDETTTDVVQLMNELLEQRGEEVHVNLAAHWVTSEIGLDQDEALDYIHDTCEIQEDENESDVVLSVKDEYDDLLTGNNDTPADENDDLTAIDGVGEGKEQALNDAGIETIEDVLDATEEELRDIDGISDSTVERIQREAKRFRDPIEVTADEAAKRERNIDPDATSKAAIDIDLAPGEATSEHYHGLPVLENPGGDDEKHPLVQSMNHDYYESPVSGVSMGGLGAGSGQTFETDSTDVEVACKLLADNDFCLALRGQTGTGKNMLLKHISAETNRPVIRVNFGAGMTYEELVGQTTLESDEHGNQTLGWEDGLLTMAMRNGWIFIADEMNAAPPEVMMPLHSVTEENPELTLKKKGEVVRPHPSFRFVATMNPPEAGKYGGTNRLNEAFKTRFYTIDIDYLPEDEETALVDEKVNADRHIIDEEDIEGMVRVANRLRDRAREGDNLPTASTREIIKAAKLCDIMEPSEAMKCVIHGMMDPQHDSNAINEIVGSFL